MQIRRSPSSRLATATLLALTACGSLTASALAQAQGQDTGQQTITATGVARAAIKPANRNSETSIREAVEAAERATLPQAVKEAREYAEQLAAASGLTLGRLLSIAQGPSSPYPPFFGPSGAGFTPFGPGRYCGTVRRPIFKRVKGTRRRKVVGFTKRRTCRVPPFAISTVTVTFAAS